MGSQARRPVRVANCSGYKSDPSGEMYLQATLGDVDFITGDYLAEMNLAENAEKYRAGTHQGFEPTAWAAFQESIEVIHQKGIKAIVNAGSLNPRGLAEKVAELALQKQLKLQVAFVEGDDLLPELGPDLASIKNTLPPHLDSENSSITLPASTFRFKNRTSVPIVSANAYLGARAIVTALRGGASIIICGRVSDASPVIGAAWFWHNWDDTSYDALAGALISGHLIECSAYVCGGNFCGFTEYDIDIFVKPGFPIAEIAWDGTCVVTKHEGTGGMVTVDTVRCQFLYELQGSVYLNSDVKAYLKDVRIQKVGKDRVHVSGIKGRPPPPTTKAAIFYRGGYQCSLLVNATGYGTSQKWHLFERQLRGMLENSGQLKDFDDLDFQIVGVPELNPSSQLSGTTYCRVFAEAEKPETLYALTSCFTDIALRHFSGFHSALDFRTALPKPFLAYYPALYPQSSLSESACLLSPTSPSRILRTLPTGHPPAYEALEKRENQVAPPLALSSISAATQRIRLGDIALARSGDKGSNLNIGIFVQTAAQYEWLRSFLSHEGMKTLMGKDWKAEYHLERVEFPGIYAVHFVVYGILGRGVSGSSRLDSLGKGFADWIRDRWVDVPVGLVTGTSVARL